MDGARLATSDDVPRLADLCRKALAELAPTRGGAVFVVREGRAEPVESSIHQALGDPCCRVVAGTFDEQVIGYGLGRIEDLRDGTRLGVIEDIFVDEQGRGVGVGAAVMQQLLAWFGEHGCRGVDATALPGNRATKNFFEGSGFSARLIVMHHVLRSGPTGGAGGQTE